MSLGESRLCVLAAAIALAVMGGAASAQELYDGSTPTTGTNSHEVIRTFTNGKRKGSLELWLFCRCLSFRHVAVSLSK